MNRMMQLEGEFELAPQKHVLLKLVDQDGEYYIIM
jgi:hypothetical protein